MDITERRKFYERVYFFELDKRERIYTRLKLPITVLTYMASINFFLITEAITLIFKNFVIFNMPNAFIVISLYVLIRLSHCIYKVLSGWIYNEVSPKDFDEYYDKLIEYYKKYFDEDLSKVGKTLEKNLTRQLMEYANHNQNINLKRNAYIVKFIEILPYYSVVLVLFYMFLLYNALNPN